VDTRLDKPDGCIENFLVRLSIPFAERIRSTVEAKGTVISTPSGKIDEPVEENLVAKIPVSESPSNLVNSFLFLLALRREKVKNLSPYKRFFMQGLLKDRIKRREMGWLCVQRIISLFTVQVDLDLLEFR
jgi:hypothetical protein